MERIQADVAEVRSRLLSAEGPLRSLTVDEGGVDLLVSTRDHARAVRVTAVLVEPGDYPATPALLTCDDDPETARALAPLGPEFQDAAPVAKLVARVLQSLGLDAGLDLDSLHPMVAANESAEADDFSSMDLEEEDDEELGGTWEAEEYLSDVEEEEDKEWTVELGRRQGAWEKFEEERRLSWEGENQPGGVSLSEEVAQNRQIFDTRAAFKMLSKELLSILREQSFDLLVDAVNNDVYQWNVELAGFPPDSNLYHDISELQKKSSYSSVHLLITFKRGLHPFFPPRVEILRPRFKGAMAWAIASHPMLNLSNWDPLIRLKELIMRIKEFLTKHARVDMDSPLNSTHWHANGGYSPAERHLARLEALCELLPRCISNPEHRNLYNSRDVFIDEDRIAALRQGDNQLKKARKDKCKGPWAAGTGFGSGHTDSDKDAEVWDARKSKIAQRARDVEMERVLIDLSKSLAAELVTCNATNNEMHCSACENGSCSDVHAKALVRTLDESCLLPFLWREMGNASFTDVSGTRAEYYLSIMKVVKELSRPISCSILYSTVDGGESSVSTAITNLKEQAEYYLRVMATNSISSSGDDGCQGSANIRQADMVEQPQSPAAIGLPSRKDAAVEVEKKLGLELATLVVQVAESLDSDNKQKASGQSSSNSSSAGNSTDEDDYLTEMKKNQVDFIPNLEKGHLFANDASRESSFSKERMVRLAREMAGLQSLLPVNHSSSILVRVDEQKFTLWRALIFGPEDTPYSGGCFLFDIYFPTTYPQSSPKVQIRTTGGGKVRFNPNLYACGKVCLSLLGTWSGGAGETWDPNASTCFQVLVSIQSLILVPDPYFNEPGFEDSMHTDQGKSASRRYNQDIRENTIHRAMIDYLRCPPPEFESAVLTHFRMRKKLILDTCNSWIADAEQNRSLERTSSRLRTLIDDEGRGQSHLSRLKSLVSELQGLLDKL